MKNLKILVAVAVTFLVIGIVAGSKLAKPVESNEVETKTRTVTRRVVLPDGTRTTERVTDLIQMVSERSKPVEKSWRVSALAKAKLDAIAPQYGAHVDRRILGPVWIGVGAYQDGTAQVSVGWEF